MSANIDSNQTIKFHYGNALEDFGHLLPIHEQSNKQLGKNADKQAKDIKKCLNRLDLTLDAIEKTQSELNYFLSDINKMLR